LGVGAGHLDKSQVSCGHHLLSGILESVSSMMHRCQGRVYGDVCGCTDSWDIFDKVALPKDGCDQ
jgi:hypothetical protein